jgi:hypothetical protein
MDKYKVYCETDNKWECVIASAEPTVCPTNGAHTLRAGSANILDKDILVNDGTPKELTLADYKQLRFNEIDGKTLALLAPGFTYDSKTFSLSSNAQLNWSEIHSNKTEFTFPLDVSTIDNDTYALAEANVDAFWTAGKDKVQEHIDSGRVLKKSVKDAVDEAAVDAVVDNR